MGIDGKLGSISRNDERARGAGHSPVIRTTALKADNGEYPVGLILAVDAAGDGIPWAVVEDEVIGAGEAAAIEVADEVLAAGDGTKIDFMAQLANGDIVPGSVTISATVGTAGVDAVDDGLGAISGDGVIGSIDYDSGLVVLKYTTAPDNATNVTADYSHTPPAVTFNSILEQAPVRPGSVVVTDGVETFADDGFGRLTGDAGGIGSVNYGTGAVTVTFAVAPTPGTDVVAAYDLAIKGVLDEDVDTASSTSGLYVAHGSVRADVLKVGIAGSAPTTAQLAMLESMGIWPE